MEKPAETSAQPRAIGILGPVCGARHITQTGAVVGCLLKPGHADGCYALYHAPGGFRSVNFARPD